MDTPSSPAQLNPNDVSITVRRFYRPEEFNAMDAYLSDIHTIYWSDKTKIVPVTVVKGKCAVWRKKDFVFMDFPDMNEYTFFCEYVVAAPDHRPKLQPVGGMEVEAILGQAKLPIVGVVSEDCLECPDHHSSMDNLCLV
nr:DNA (cytosine-5)-methyltransferase 1B [Ipomoea batatas]